MALWHRTAAASVGCIAAQRVAYKVHHQPLAAGQQATVALQEVLGRPGGGPLRNVGQGGGPAELVGDQLRVCQQVAHLSGICIHGMPAAGSMLVSRVRLCMYVDDAATAVSMHVRKPWHDVV